MGKITGRLGLESSIRVKQQRERELGFSEQELGKEKLTAPYLSPLKFKVH